MIQNNSLQNWFRRINNNMESINLKYQWIVLLLYMASLIIISYFHEPWFDEAQSWIIAKDVSFKDILFFIPHYEGHPPLWHIYLIPFAKSGLTYEMGIKSASIILNCLSMGIVISKAPFPKIVRYFIPFTYFFFYQYGVISRCYSLLLLGFVLAALWWQQKNEKPFLFILSLMIICASSAYGIILCGGITIIWLWEIWKGRSAQGFLKYFIRDKRFSALLFLFVFTIALIFLIIPRPDTYAINLPENSNNFIYRLFFMLILAPMESLFFKSIPGRYFLQDIILSPASMIVSAILFLIFAIIIVLIGLKTKKLKLLVIPYIPFALFSALFYFSQHHIGIITAFFLFWFWICWSDRSDSIENIFNSNSRFSNLFSRVIITVFSAFCIITSIYWTITASIIDINTNYSSARQTSQFLKKQNLDNTLIMTEWYINEKDNGVTQVNTTHQSTPRISAYFDENIFYTHNNGIDNLRYNTHILPSSKDIKNTLNLWSSYGAPDVLLGQPNLYAVFGNNITYESYSLVKIIEEAQIVKNHRHEKPYALCIYLRKDLLEFYNLSEVENIDLTKYSNETIN